MKREKRVLLIEDIEGSRKTYWEIITLAGYSVDAVGTLQEAINLIERKTYHVAVVDITLDVEDIYNRDGLKAIEYVYNLGEGTEAVILSAQDSIDVAVDAFERFKLVRYLEKAKLMQPSDLSMAVDQAFQRCRIKDFGPYESVLSFLAGDKDDRNWAIKCVEVIRPSHGRAGLQDFLNKFCKSFTPLMPKIATRPPMAIDDIEKTASGEFWSKSIGMAVSLVVRSSKESGQMPERDDDGNLITKHEKAGLLGIARALPDRKRQEFADRL